MDLTKNLFQPLVLNSTIANDSLSLSGFKIEPQEMSLWCWAACTSAICNFYGDIQVPSQRQLEATIKNKPSCAYGPLNSYCNDTCDLEISLDSVGHLHVPFDDIISSQDVLNEINLGRPVCCQMNLPAIGGHAVIIVDASGPAGDQLTLQIADPAGGEIIPMYYANFRDNYRNLGGTWIRTYKTI